MMKIIMVHHIEPLNGMKMKIVIAINNHKKNVNDWMVYDESERAGALNRLHGQQAGTMTQT